MEFDALVATALGDAVRIVEKVTLKGDASSRQYHRLVLDGAEDVNSLVVMELPPDSRRSDEVSSGESLGELPFINMTRHLNDKEVRVPEVILDASSSGAILLEDLGDNTLERVVGGLPRDLWGQWYEVAVDLLVSMHQAMWPIPDECLASGRFFNYDLLRWELDHYREWGAEALLEMELKGPMRRELDEQFDWLAREIASLPTGFVHRDFQSRNLMVLGQIPKMSSMVVIDFQDSLVGPRIYDLVALLNDSYLALDNDLKNHMIARYAAGMKFDLDQLLREFYLVTVQRKLKDGGRFVFIDRVKGNPSFLPFVSDSFHRVSYALKQVEELFGLNKLLKEIDSKHFVTPL